MEILAVIIVPGKIITGICFPNYQIENKCPHVTLFTNEWQARLSNDLLFETCHNPRGAFHEAYNNLKLKGQVFDSNHKTMKADAVKIDKKNPGS